MRVLAQPIDCRRASASGTLRLANPLTPVDAGTVEPAAHVRGRRRARAGACGRWRASASPTLIAAPLRRMHGVAAAASAGDLSARAGPVAARGEVGVLAAAFDHMLERLERAFTRQRDFVSDASHELRTPLAVLRAQVELLDRETDERSRHEATATLLRRLDELDRLVGDMLTLASAEAGELIEPRPIDLGDFFEDVRRDLPLFGERDFRMSAVGGTLEADPDRLTQVLRNLVRNAVAHTEPGDRVELSAHAPRRAPRDRGQRQPGPEYLRTSSTGSSSASTGSTRAARATAAAAASGSRSRGRSSRRTAGRSAPSPGPARVPRSASSCRATARRGRERREACGHDRRLRLGARPVPGRAGAGGCPFAARCPPASRSPRSRVLVGELGPPAGGAGAGRVAYQHHPELAPTTELRHLQYAEDARHGVGKRSRIELAPEYVARYTNEILDRVDLARFARELPDAVRRLCSASSAILRPVTGP